MGKHISEYFTFSGLFDSHTHLSAQEFDVDRKLIVENAKNQQLQAILDASVNFENSLKSVQYSSEFEDQVFSWVGTDPEVFEPGSSLFVGLDIGESWFKNEVLRLRDLIEKSRDLIIGVGETGMDFYHDNGDSPEIREQSRNLQKRLFEIHIEIAKSFDLPLTIHSRGAEKECFEILNSKGGVGIFHSYTGDYTTAAEILDSGLGLGVNGIFTFKNAASLRDLYKRLLGKVSSDWSPADFYKKGIFFETDAPYLSPEGKRGERNQPANAALIFDTFVKALS
jgi:TatD DNase family protein